MLSVGLFFNLFYCPIFQYWICTSYQYFIFKLNLRLVLGGYIESGWDFLILFFIFANGPQNSSSLFTCHPYVTFISCSLEPIHYHHTLRLLYILHLWCNVWTVIICSVAFTLEPFGNQMLWTTAVTLLDNKMPLFSRALLQRCLVVLY